MDHRATPAAVSDADIAIIGMACRAPGADNLAEFWQNLQHGVESISFFSPEALVAAGNDPALVAHPDYVPAQAILSDPGLFDAAFFGYSANEAAMLDPQQRLFLECAAEALEMAGYRAAAYRGVVGVYAGAGMSTYLINNLMPNYDFSLSASGVQLATGNDSDFLPTRISYKLNLRGPSVNVQTACSTSLVAIHLACQSILEGECHMALAGGVSIGLPQERGYLYQPGMAFSSDGRCRAFDAAASGTVGGNGAAIVVLKRLVDALREGDTVLAVIKGSAINNDGAEKIGFTAPSVDGQAAAIAEAQEIANVHPETITYVEAHGTATELGDPIAITALTQAFRTRGAQNREYCAIGSLKTNVGHLNTAAGAGGLIKTVLALQHKMIPPSLHFTAPNPQIDFANSPFYVNAALTPWETNGTPRRAGISSFGLGGTNAHIVVEEAPMLPTAHASESWQLLLLSAQTPTALDTLTGNLAAHLQQHPGLNLADVAYTLQVGRQPFDHRRMLVCRSHDEAVTALETGDASHLATAIAMPDTPSVVFMFPGAGTQYTTMGQELYETEPVFRQEIDRCVECLMPHLGLDLRTLLYHPDDPERAAEQLQQPFLALPALFMTEYALAQLWMSWGIQPQAMIGHSLGEYVAACLAGVFTPEDGLALVNHRAQLIRTLPPGAMLTVSLAEEEIQALINEDPSGADLSIALVNTPSSCVVAGASAAIDRLQARLQDGDVDHRRLPIAGAGHSALMEPIMAPFRQFVSTLTLRPPQRPFVSNLSGTWITASEVTDPEYWVKHLRHTVRFATGLQTLLDEPNRILLEVGPGRAMASLTRQHPARQSQVVLTSLRHPQDEQSDVAFLLNTLGRLWLAGVPVDWNGFYGTREPRCRLPLPTYPFERQRYWVEPPAGNAAKHRLGKKPDMADWFYLPAWKQSTPAALYPQKTWPEAPQSWLVFADGSGCSEHLIEGLTKAGQEVIIVRIGAAFARLTPHEFVLNPQQHDDYVALVGELTQPDSRPTEVVHAWTLTTADGAAEESVFDRTARMQTYGFDSLVSLTQALDIHGWTDALAITVLTNHMHDVMGEAGRCPEKALVLGPVKVIPQEFPHITCRCVDVVVPEPGSPQTAPLIEQMLTELRSDAPDTLVAYRGPHRWTQCFEPVRLEAGQPGARLRQQGVDLITGGLGGVGLALAADLAEQVQARLILVGRTGLPERDAWAQWLTEHGEEDATSQTILRIQDLEQQGAEVLSLSADVADQGQMAAAVAQAREHFGAIHGVIHAAVVLEPGVMLRKTPASMARALAAKVQGTLVLDAIFENQPLDFMVYCSSLTGIFGSFAYVDYTAANLFQDAYAHDRTARSGQFTVSIDWDRWLHIGGSTVAFEQMLEALTGEATVGMTAREGAQAFRRIIGQPVPPQVLVSIQDLDVLLSRSPTDMPGLSDQRNGHQAVHERPDLATPYVAPQTETEQTLTTIYQMLLGLEQIGIHDDFFELGGHSLLGVRVVAQVRETLQMELSLRSLFENPTIAGLAARVDELMLANRMQEPSEVAMEQRDVGRL